MFLCSTVCIFISAYALAVKDSCFHKLPKNNSTSLKLLVLFGKHSKNPKKNHCAEIEMRARPYSKKIDSTISEFKHISRIK